MKWTRNREKPLWKHFETIVASIGWMSLLWSLGNYEETFSATTIAGIIAGIITFGFCAEPIYAQHTLATVSSWNRDMITLFSAATILVVLMMLRHVELSRSFGGSEFQKIYLSCMAIPVVLALVAYNITKISETSKKLHIHHLHIFYAIAFFTRFPTEFSRFSAGLAIGASMHGISAFGFDSTFE